MRIRQFDSRLKREIETAIRTTIDNKDVATTRWFTLYNDGKHEWALVLGYADGFDNNKSLGKYNVDGMRLCGKIAYHNNNAIMSEYDIDWTMPYDKKTSEVDDTETSIDYDGDIEHSIEWWKSEWERIQDEHKKEWEQMCSPYLI